MKNLETSSRVIISASIIAGLYVAMRQRVGFIGMLTYGVLFGIGGAMIDKTIKK